MVERRAGKRLQTAIVLAGVVAGGLTACSNGSEAGTLDPQSVTGVNLDVGELRVRNAVIVAADDGGLTVSLTVVNSGSTDDAITDVSVTNDGEQVAAQLRPSSIPLEPGTATVVPGEPRPTIDVEPTVVAGGHLPVRLQFANAGPVDVLLPVVNQNSPYGGGEA